MFVDTHAHLYQEEFDADRAEVIARAQAAGVSNIVCIAADRASSEASITLASQHAGLFASVGIHPNYCHEAAPDDWQRVVDLASSPQVVALGETGLDRYWDFAPFELQQEYFDRHIVLSQKMGLPFIVHTRECDADVVAMLQAARERGPLCGVMHSFAGDLATAETCLALGMHISFSGMATFKKSVELRDVAAAIPADRLLIETDSPYLSPHPHRGKRNEPARVVDTARVLADARGVTLEDLAATTTANARSLFRLSKVGDSQTSF